MSRGKMVTLKRMSSETDEEFESRCNEIDKMKKISDDSTKILKEKQKAARFLKEIGIPIGVHEIYEWPKVDAGNLYDILMDEEKLKILLFKLRNKAFL